MMYTQAVSIINWTNLFKRGSDIEIIIFYDKFLVFEDTRCNGTSEQGSDECGRLFITINGEVFHQIVVFVNTLFMKGEQNARKPAMFMIFFHLPN